MWGFKRGKCLKKMEASVSGEVHGIASVQELNKEKGVSENKCVHGACEW